MKVVGIIMLVIILLLLIAAAVYCYRCTNYWQKDHKKTLAAGIKEKQVVLDNGSVINYAEGPDNGKALLLIHGQTGSWEDYERVLPELSENWHIYAVDCYGHGQSEHDETKYFMSENGDDLIWFVEHVIGKETVISGHSSGGLLAAYVAAYGDKLITGAVLEDPPAFSTEPDYFERSFAYQDTYKPLHNYLQSAKEEHWETYYLRHCLWGRLYMKSAMDGLGNYAQKYLDKHPDEPLQFFFMPESINAMFLSMPDYDFQFGDHFYDYSWHSGITHAEMMADIRVPTIFLHVEEMYTDDGILMAASSNEQAEKAAALIRDCELITLSGNHDIHRYQPDEFIHAINRMQ